MHVGVETYKEGARAKDELGGIGDGQLTGGLDQGLGALGDVVDAADELAGRDEGVGHGGGAEEDEVEREAHLEGSLGLKVGVERLTVVEECMVGGCLDQWDLIILY